MGKVENKLAALSAWTSQGCVPSLRQAAFVEVDTKAESGLAYVDRPVPVFTYQEDAPRFKQVRY